MLILAFWQRARCGGLRERSTWQSRIEGAAARHHHCIASSIEAAAAEHTVAAVTLDLGLWLAQRIHALRWLRDYNAGVPLRAGNELYLWLALHMPSQIGRPLQWKDTVISMGILCRHLLQ